MDAPPQRRKTPLQLTIIRAGLNLLSRISPALTAKIANQLWFKTRRFAEPKREADWLKDANWTSIQVEKQRIQLYQWGHPENDVVLLVHGWNGRAAQLGKFALALVENGYRVIGFDAPGHGRSEGKQTNLPAISAVIKAIYAQEGEFSAAISHSFGGLCLLHAATEEEPVNVKKFVCIAAPHNAEVLLDYFASVLHLQPTVVEQQKNQLEKLFGKDIWQRFSIASMSAELDPPGLIIHDEKDKEVPVSIGRKIDQVWENSTFVETTGLGHQRILRDDRVVEIIVGFID